MEAAYCFLLLGLLLHVYLAIKLSHVRAYSCVAILAFWSLDVHIVLLMCNTIQRDPFVMLYFRCVLLLEHWEPTVPTSHELMSTGIVGARAA